MLRLVALLLELASTLARVGGQVLGHAAVDHGGHVSWFSLEQLGHIIRRGRADDSTGRAIKRIMRIDVIIIDDIGLLPVTAETAEALYRVVDGAYEKRSIGHRQDHCPL